MPTQPNVEYGYKHKAGRRSALDATTALGHHLSKQEATVNQSLSDADRAVLERAAEIQALRTPAAVRHWAGAGTYDITSTLQSYTELAGIAQTLLGDLAAIIRRLDDDDEDDDAEDETYHCATCKATIAIFIDHGDGWHHYRGDGTPDSPVELYDAGHPATLTGLLP